MAKLVKEKLVREGVRVDPSREIGERSWYGSRDTEAEIAVDIDESDEDYYLKADVPGAKKTDIEVSIDGDRIWISANIEPVEVEQKGITKVVRERCRGTRSRRIFLDCEVDPNKAVATYHEGVLELKLPKKPGKRGKAIAIK